MIKLSNYITLIFVFLLNICFTTDIQGQQDPQFTHYMYNTMTINPGYTGSIGHGVITGIGRTQWVGYDGAPDSQTLSFHTPLPNEAVGLGFNLVNDKLGPAHETFFDANVSYAIETSREGKLAFGLKLGGRLLNIDWSKGNYEHPDVSFSDNIKNSFLPTIGAGLYYYTTEGYVGLSVPSFLPSEHYDSEKEVFTNKAIERMHFLLIGGYVFDLTDDIKFKPATLLKGVQGAPLIIDVSANFLFNDKFTTGLAWRCGDSVSALLGFQANRNFYVGYGYDLTTTKYHVTNVGTHEIMLRYDFQNMLSLRSPRFF